MHQQEIIALLALKNTPNIGDITAKKTYSPLRKC